MSAKEFVDALQNGKNLDAEDAFKVAMSSKVGDALEDKRKDVASKNELSQILSQQNRYNKSIEQSIIQNKSIQIIKYI